MFGGTPLTSSGNGNGNGRKTTGIVIPAAIVVGAMGASFMLGRMQGVTVKEIEELQSKIETNTRAVELLEARIAILRECVYFGHSCQDPPPKWHKDPSGINFEPADTPDISGQEEEEDDES